MIPDADAMLARWREMGEPEIHLKAGTDTSKLDKFLAFYGEHPEMLPESWMDRIRKQLGLPQVETE